MHRSHDKLPAEFESTGALLERERAQLSALELDGIKRRVMSRAASPTKGNFMKSRLAILATLVMGLLMSGTGATLAIDGIQSSQDASVAQYGSGEKGGVLGNNQSGGADDVIPPPASPGTGAAPDDFPGRETAQPGRQVELGGPTPSAEELPFTGYAGITVLLLGLALLAGGLVLRNRTRHQQ